MTRLQATATATAPAAGALVLSPGLGIRQSFGRFVAPLDVAFGIGVATTSRALIGGCNIVGSYAAGLIGAHGSPHVSLDVVCLVRGAAIPVFFLAPEAEFGTLVFAAVMGLS